MFEEVLFMSVGSAVAKNILKLWLREPGLAQDIGTDVIDLLASKVSSFRTRQRGKLQFDAIGTQIAESLEPLFAEARLTDQGKQAVALAIADTLNRTPLDSTMLARHNLDPTELSAYLIAAQPMATRDFSEAETAFYERILSEVAAYTVDIASQLPAFNERTLGEILQGQDELLKIARQTLNEMQRIRAETRRTNPDEEVARFEEQYCLAVIRNLDRLELFGVDVEGTSKRHRLSVAYVSLSVACDVVGVDGAGFAAWPEIAAGPGDDAEDDEQPQTIAPVERVLARSPQLLIRGQAGSGKTTLLHWIAVNAAGRSFDGELAQWNNAIPFFIPLRRFVDVGLPAPEEFPRLVAQTIAGEMPRGWVHRCLESGRALVLVDSLDELPEQQRSAVRNWLADLVAMYADKGVRFVVTSRPSAIGEGWLAAESFADAELQPMELHDIAVFVDHWHAAVRESERDEVEQAALDTLARDLKQTIRRERAIRNLATSPLLCAAICALHRVRHGYVPTLRIDLYRALYDMLLTRRDKERDLKIESKDYPRLNDGQKQVLLEYLAYWMMINKLSIVAVEKVDERLGYKLSTMPNIPPGTTGERVRRLFVDRSGLVREPSVGLIDFTHRTLQEFLAAKAILDEDYLGFLVEHAHEDQWREVIVLASGLASRPDREQLISGLIQRGDKNSKLRHQLHLLAVTCLESTVDLSPDIQTEVKQRLAKLIPPATMAEAKAIAAVGELAVPYLKYNKKHKAKEAAACVRALAVIGGDAAFDVLKTYAPERRSTVIDELLTAADSFDRDTYFREIIAALEFDKLSLSVSSLVGVEHLTRLSQLKLAGLDQPISNGSIETVISLSPLAALQNLIALSLTDFYNVRNLAPLARLGKLRRLELGFFHSLVDLSSLEMLRELEDLRIYSLRRISEVTSLVSLTKLVNLDIADIGKCVDINSLVFLTRLVKLRLVNFFYVVNLLPLSDLKNLMWLQINGFHCVTDLTPITKLPRLVSLNLTSFPNIISISPLSELAKFNTLTQLRLQDFQNVDDLSPLSALTSLTSLTLHNFNVSDLRPLSKLINLTSLTLSGFEGVLDVTPLSELSNLTSLTLGGFEEVHDLNPLSQLKNLRTLYLRGFPADVEIPPELTARFHITRY